MLPSLFFNFSKSISVISNLYTYFIQEEHNSKNGIISSTIIKSFSGGVIETLRGAKKGKGEKKKIEITDLSGEALDKRIEKLKKLMKEAS
jgi:excinuclease ABC subunit B